MDVPKEFYRDSLPPLSLTEGKRADLTVNLMHVEENGSDQGDTGNE